MTDKELKKLIKTLRSNGILKYKTADCELELSPDAITTTAKPSGIADTKDNIPTEGNFTEEETLLWSSAGIPDEKVTQ